MVTAPVVAPLAHCMTPTPDLMLAGVIACSLSGQPGARSSPWRRALGGAGPVAKPSPGQMAAALGPRLDLNVTKPTLCTDRKAHRTAAIRSFLKLQALFLAV